jgi:hypothetical protein
VDGVLELWFLGYNLTTINLLGIHLGDVMGALIVGFPN